MQREPRQPDNSKRGTRPCKRGPQCHFLKNGTCWFYHPESHKQPRRPLLQHENRQGPTISKKTSFNQIRNYSRDLDMYEPQRFQHSRRQRFQHISNPNRNPNPQESRYRGRRLIKQEYKQEVVMKDISKRQKYPSYEQDEQQVEEKRPTRRRDINNLEQSKDSRMMQKQQERRYNNCNRQSRVREILYDSWREEDQKVRDNIQLEREYQRQVRLKRDLEIQEYKRQQKKKRELEEQIRGFQMFEMIQRQKRQQRQRRQRMQEAEVRRKKQYVECPVQCILKGRNRWFFERNNHIPIVSANAKEGVLDQNDQNECSICSEEFYPTNIEAEPKSGQGSEKTKNGKRSSIMSFFKSVASMVFGSKQQKTKKEQVKYITELYCKHHFHPECIQEWFYKNQEEPTCPYCRKDFTKHKEYQKWDENYEARTD